jgi:pimeloyl-ACP methyl ester carboxylesterase
VRRFHADATRAGYRSNGEAGERPRYHPGYYAAYALDPDGNNIEVVNHHNHHHQTAVQPSQPRTLRSTQDPTSKERLMSIDQNDMHPRPNIVLVHGAWADGSSWSSVIERLQADGYHVTAPQFPLTSLADDVARLRQVLALQDGPTIIVGHSYGGQVMTALGSDAPNVVGLVYITAFGLDEGESLGGLLAQGPPSPALAHQFVDDEGFAWLTEDDFVNHFASGIDPVKARVLYAVQQPLAASAFNDGMTDPAWKLLPSWYLVTADDQALPPDAQRLFANRMGGTTVEVPSGHLVMVSHPPEVVKLTETAAEAALAAGPVS